MTTAKSWIDRLAAGVLLGACAALPAAAADLPKSFKSMLADLKADEGIFADVDSELAVPAAWIEGAKKEGELRLIDTHADKEFNRMIQPFLERYPFIKFNYSRGNYQNRTTRALIAMKTGSFTSDVGKDFGGFYTQFKDAGFMHDMRELPNFNKVPKEARGDDGSWIAHRRQYWCVSYNTKLFKKEDMPKTWDGFLDDPRWRDGKIGVGNRPQLWILMLWGYHGPDYAKRYIARLFADVKPQLRKEGMNAMVSLTVAGELPVSIPSSEYRVELMQAKGAPVGYHCPEPVPASMAEMAIFKGTPHLNAARIYVNWLLSKEGQIAQFYVSRSVPIHEGLQRREFLPFAEEILGRKIALRRPEMMREASVEVQKIWGEHWARAGGEMPERTVAITLEAVKDGGAAVDFNIDGQTETAGVSGTRTAITRAGKKIRRNALMPGLECRITYRGTGSEATVLACK